MVVPVKNSLINQRVTYLNVKGNQDPTVMNVLFSLFSDGRVRSLDIESSNLYDWINYIRNIGPSLRELSILNCAQLNILKCIATYCPYLEKLNVGKMSAESEESNILQNIANNYPHLRSLEINTLSYNTSVEADADLTLFAEKCPQLEELSLNCPQLTDQSVIALAQHCSRIKKLKIYGLSITATSLIALSERGLPLEELGIPMIPIPSAEIAAQCAHALSRIRYLITYSYHDRMCRLLHSIQYMTGLRYIELDGAEDHLLVPHLLLLQGQCECLERLTIKSYSSINPQQLCELTVMYPKLHTFYSNKSTCTSTDVLVELARNCPNLQKVTLSSGDVTEESVLVLAAHCRQLQVLSIPRTTVTRETLRYLFHNCRHLTELNMCSKRYNSKVIRAVREIVRKKDRESSNTEVIVSNSSNTCCLLM